VHTRDGRDERVRAAEVGGDNGCAAGGEGSQKGFGERGSANEGEDLLGFG
jgi:hypothetical protein